jgi:DNA-binding response OmpR family regulator
VEDNLVVAKALTLHLQRHGYLVDHVGEVSHAEAAVKNNRPELIILDIGLPTRDPNSPVWDGVDFLEWLHCMKLELPVIVYSSTSPKLIQQRLGEVKPVAFFQKPAVMKDLLAAIEANLPKLPETAPEPAPDSGTEAGG